MNKGLFIEPLATEIQSLLLITDAECKAAETFGASRRREYFAWRALVRRELGQVEISYNAVGAPILPDFPDVYLGVSHGAGRVAVCISDSPCAVDIESLNRPFDRIRSRYLSATEESLCLDLRFPAVAWCAKECLYKLSGQRELSLLMDTRLSAVGADWIEGSVKKGDAMRFSFRYLEDAVVVWKL